MKVIVMPNSNESKFKRFLRGANEKVKEFGRSIRRNKDEIIMYGPIVAGAIMTVYKIVHKGVAQHRDRYMRDHHVYDPMNGHHLMLNRKLSTREWVRVDQRRKAGESLTSILHSMGALR